MSALFKGSLDDAAGLMVSGIQKEIQAAMMRRLREVVEQEFDQIAKEVSQSMVKSIVEFHRDLRTGDTIVHVQITKKATP